MDTGIKLYNCYQNCNIQKALLKATQLDTKSNVIINQFVEHYEKFEPTLRQIDGRSVNRKAFFRNLLTNNSSDKETYAKNVVNSLDNLTSSQVIEVHEFASKLYEILDSSSHRISSKVVQENLLLSRSIAENVQAGANLSREEKDDLLLNIGDRLSSYYNSSDLEGLCQIDVAISTCETITFLCHSHKGLLMMVGITTFSLAYSTLIESGAYSRVITRVINTICIRKLFSRARAMATHPTIVALASFSLYGFVMYAVNNTLVLAQVKQATPAIKDVSPSIDQLKLTQNALNKAAEKIKEYRPTSSEFWATKRLVGQVGYAIGSISRTLFEGIFSSHVDAAVTGSSEVLNETLNETLIKK